MLSCGLEEHTHTDECYADTADANESDGIMTMSLDDGIATIADVDTVDASNLSKTTEFRFTMYVITTNGDRETVYEMSKWNYDTNKEDENYYFKDAYKDTSASTSTYDVYYVSVTDYIEKYYAGYGYSSSEITNGKCSVWYIENGYYNGNYTDSSYQVYGSYVYIAENNYDVPSGYYLRFVDTTYVLEYGSSQTHLYFNAAVDFSSLYGTTVAIADKDGDSGNTSGYAMTTSASGGSISGVKLSTSFKATDDGFYNALYSGDTTAISAATLVWTITDNGDDNTTTCYITTEINGTTYYLSLGSSGAVLTTTPDSSCVIYAYGSSGAVKLVSADGYYLTYSDGSFTSGDDGTTVYLVTQITDCTVSTVNPNGTVINLFDYSVMNDVSLEGKVDGYYGQPTSSDGVTEDYSADTGYNQSGINYNHVLKFTIGGYGAGENFWGVSANTWTGNKAGPFTGIMQSMLLNGYPAFNTTESIFGINSSGTMVTGAYYDTNKANDVAADYSAAYLYNPNLDVTYTDSSGTTYSVKESYENVSSLLQVKDGYYYYNSHENYAEFDESTNSFTVYNDYAVSSGGTETDVGYGQFFPFDSYDSVSHTTPCTTGNLDHYFGMSLTSKFIQQYDGHVDATEDANAMIFQFRGDDDVWLYVDDVLVADIGGIHDSAGFEIDFSTGMVNIITYATTDSDGNDSVTYGNSYSLYSAYKAAYTEMYEAEGYSGDDLTIAVNAKLDETFDTSSAITVSTKLENTDGSETNTLVNEDGNTVNSVTSYIYYNSTYHTLKFYYLERGGNSSNLYLNYNLNSYLPASIAKVNQYGDIVEGAGFAIYATDSDYNYFKYGLTTNGWETHLALNTDLTYDDLILTSDELDEYTLVTDDNLEYWQEINEDITYGDYVDANGNIIVQALYYGTTDSSGQITFVDENGLAYAVPELEKLFGSYMMLREITVPDGYRRINDEIELYFYNNKAIFCNNTFESGAFSSNDVMIKPTNALLLYNTTKLDLEHVTSTYTEDDDDSEGYYQNTVTYSGMDSAGETTIYGSLFAVIVRYVGTTGTDDNGNTIYIGTNGDEYSTWEEAAAVESNWALVWGSGSEGRSILGYYGNETGTNLTGSILNDYGGSFETAIATLYSSVAREASVSDNGEIAINIDDLPGDMRYYYDMLGDDEKDQTMFDIWVYWSDAETVDTDTTLYKVNIREGGDAYDTEDVYGASIEVTNILNRIFLQKNDKNGNAVIGATFGMYEVVEPDAMLDDTNWPEYYDKDDSTVYYVANETYKTSEGDELPMLLYLYDDDGNNTTDDGKVANNVGRAYVKGDTDTLGTYIVDGETGDITVTFNSGTDDETVYTISALEIEQTLAIDDENNPSNESGTATFSHLVVGYYYAREIATPTGLGINTTEVMVEVDTEKILANAGTADDGITVGRGAGYLASSLQRFGSIGVIQSQLSWMYAVMKTTQDSATFADTHVDETYYAEEQASDGTWSWENDESTTWKYITENYWAGDTNTWKLGSELLGHALTTYGISETAATDAATLYLVYSADDSDSNLLFNYAPNSDRIEWTDEDGNALTTNYSTNSSTGNYSRRLYTQVGWSYLEIYQDDEYGADKAAENGARYDLMDEIVDSSDPDDVIDGLMSQVFSRSVYIQVTDPYVPSDLRISNRVLDAEENDLTDDTTEFTYTIEITFPSGSIVTDETLEYIIYDAVTFDSDDDYTVIAGNDNKTPVNNSVISTGKAAIEYDDETDTYTVTLTVTLTGYQAIVIEDIPYGSTYTVTQTKNTRYNTYSVRDNEKAAATQSLTKEDYDDESGEPYTYVDTINVDGTGDSESAFTYTDTGTVYHGIVLLASGEAEDGTFDNLSTVDFTNIKLTDLVVWKVDAEDSNVTLADAVFTLSKTEDDTTYYYATYTYTVSTEVETTDDSGETKTETVETAYTLGELLKTQVVDGETQYYITRLDNSATASSSGTWVTEEQLSTYGYSIYHTTNENGYFTIDIDNIEEGVYTLTEVASPDGYYRLTYPVTVTIDKVADDTDADNYSYEFDAGGTYANASEYEGVKATVDSDNALALVITNITGYELPETGGSGVWWLYIAGALLTLLSGICLIWRFGLLRASPKRE